MKSYTTVDSGVNGSIEDDVNFYERELERYMQDSLDSTQRSRKNLEQSEQVGIATAQVLLVALGIVLSWHSGYATKCFKFIIGISFRIY